MKTPHYLFCAIICVLLTTISIGQRVGIGTNAPIARLSVDSGLNIDQANVNGFSLESALTFGNNKKVGIGSRRTEGTNKAGLDFYTQGSRRMVIDSFGSVGIGTTSPSRLLHVAGPIYSTGYMIANYGIAAGIGNIAPSYDVHAGIGYFNTRVGIGITPNSTYALYVGSGPARFTEDVRIDGILNPNNVITIGNNATIQGTLDVQSNLNVTSNITVANGKGIVRSNDGTQLKIINTSIQLAANLSAGGSVDSGELFFSSFGGTPQVFMGNRISSTNDNWSSLEFIPFAVDTNSCKFRVFNHGSTSVSVSVTYAIMTIGPQ